MQQITEALKEQFAKNIGLVMQQEGSKLRKFVTNESQDTEVIHFETMHGYEAKARFKDADGYHANGTADKLETLEFRTPKITRRQATAQAYYWEAAMDRNDKLNLLTDPTSKFPKMAGFAMGRKQDQLIINSFGASVNGGRTGQDVIFFDIANNVVPLGCRLVDGTNALHDNDLSNVADAQKNAKPETIRKGGLTVDKLLKAHQILKKQTFGTNEKFYLVCSSYQIGNLLRDSQVVSHDYNNVKALVTGEVSTFAGFNFIITEMLGGIRPADGNNTFSIRDCYAFTESSIRFGTVAGSIERQIDQLIQYHYAPSLYYSESFGATRTDEGLVVCIKCLEPFDNAHNGDQWKKAEDANHKKAIHASLVPWQIFGAQARNVNNTADIADDAITALGLK
jgi:hypothetical protein